MSEKVLLEGTEFKKGTGKSPYDLKFWQDNGVIWASTKDKIKLTQNMAEILGTYTKKSFIQNAEVRGYIVEWDEEAGKIAQVGNCKTILGLEPKQNVNWREVLDVGLKNDIEFEIDMAELR